MNTWKPEEAQAQALTPPQIAQDTQPPDIPGSPWLSIKQAASVLGITERSVYHALQTGRLAGAREDGMLLVRRDSAEMFIRRGPGRRRIRSPRWHQPPERNGQMLTMITLRLRPEKEGRLTGILEAMRRENAHSLPGTAARYVVRSQDDLHEITLVLVWRVSDMPSEAERQAALAALRADLAVVLDWDTSVVKEGQSLLHA